ncbi:hypothetical protein Pcar_3467 [Syntrophotalea carbinolica DSM 2380]|uniref:Uncharacterized protein n=1 Tax=Syntrophotalea carbinolica (strain DSM 2380 / NBRC 103641 / GraBd1) TaxID=338963 RepID=J9UA89_SYNC1|nr:hypothetical protein Pcar_3467 [Syntrophotalea carbinolica DSM 2380]
MMKRQLSATPFYLLKPGSFTGNNGRKVGDEVDDIIEDSKAGDDKGKGAVAQVIQGDGFDLRFAEIVRESLRLRPAEDISYTGLDVYLIMEKAELLFAQAPSP